MSNDNNIYVIRYGYDYEHDYVLGVYSSYYYANKAKKEFIASDKFIQYQYHYVKIECYIMNESIDYE